MPDEAPIIDTTSSTQSTAADKQAPADATPAANASTEGTGAKDTSQTPATSAKVEYDFRIPEGFKAPEGFVDKMKARATEYGLSKEGASKYFENEVKALKDADAQFLKEEGDRQAAWKKSIQDDKDLGGENFAKTQETSRKGFAIASAKVSGLKEFISEYGFGSNPTIVRLLHFIGASASNDSVERATTPANGRPLSNADAIYGKAQG